MDEGFSPSKLVALVKFLGHWQDQRDRRTQTRLKSTWESKPDLAALNDKAKSLKETRLAHKVEKKCHLGLEHMTPHERRPCPSHWATASGTSYQGTKLHCTPQKAPARPLPCPLPAARGQGGRAAGTLKESLRN